MSGCAAIAGLYGMVDLPPEAVAGSASRLARALVDGGARVLQLRMKRASAAAMLAALAELRPLARACGATLIVNDRLDVALLGGADGVHLGQDDPPLAVARRLAPAGFLVGISTHSESQAGAALDRGADYIGFGPCFPTRTKENPDPVVGLEALARVCRLEVPVVAIGGIGLDTVAAVVRAGASAAALVAAVNGAPDVAAAARRVTDAFSSRAAGPSPPASC
jgi:thiamine-phosphate pyrophosphorylase